MKRIFFPLLLLLTACSTKSVQQSQPLDVKGLWVVMPMANNSNTPMAAFKAENMLAAQLRAKGLKVTHYPHQNVEELADILDSNARFNKAADWLMEQDAAYVVQGAVEEWRYKSGLDGEPVVGLTLLLTQTSDNQVIWSGAGARSGWGRESVSGVAIKVVGELLDSLTLVDE